MISAFQFGKKLHNLSSILTLGSSINFRISIIQGMDNFSYVSHKFSIFFFFFVSSSCDNLNFLS